MLQKFSLSLACWMLLFISWLHPVLHGQLVNYTWKQLLYNNPSGKAELTFLWQMGNLKIAAANLEGKGTVDFILGNNRGELSYFVNQGTLENPKLVLRELRMNALVEQPAAKPDSTEASVEGMARLVNNTPQNSLTIPLYFGERAAPAFIDLYGDGISHLLVGNKDGELKLVLNKGTPFNAMFVIPSEPIRLFTNAPSQNLNLKNLVPSVCDLNNDGVSDLLLGGKEGQVLIFYGSRNPDGQLVYPFKENITLKINGRNAVPSCVNLDASDKKSILVGQEDGSLSLFENIGSAFIPRFGEPRNYFDTVDFGGESSPFFVRDQGKNYVFLAGTGSNLRQFQLRDYDKHLGLWSLKDNLLNFKPFVNLGRKLNFTSGPLFGKNNDLLIGSEDGTLTVYKNLSRGNEVILEKMERNLFGDVLFPVSAPELGDLSGSGLMDLLLAEKSGRIHYFKNRGTATEPQFEMAVSDIISIPNLLEPIPRLLRNVQTGLLDLVVGSANQEPLYFKNVGSKTNPAFQQINFSFVFQTTSQQDTTAPSINNVYNSPAVFNWNQRKHPNLVVGRYGGSLQVFSYRAQNLNESSDLPLEFEEYLAQPFRVYNIPLSEELQFIRPYFVDLLSRGKEDMFLSNELGEVLLFTQQEAVAYDPQKIYNDFQRRQQERRIAMIKKSRGMRQNPVIDPQFRKSGKDFLKTDGKRLIPSFGKLYGSALNDLVIGQRDGKIDIYRNTGSKEEFEFVKTQTLVLPNRDKNASPLLVDLFGRGLLDLVVGSNSGRIYYFQNLGSQQAPRFVYQSEVFRGIYTQVDAVPTYLYTQQKTVPDLIFGGFHGKLEVLSNQSQGGVVKFHIENQNYLNLPDNVPFSIPRIVDLNNDGAPELVLTKDNGEIRFYQLSADKKKWQIKPNVQLEGRLPYGSAPAFAILREFGLPDMLVGTDDGQLVFYSNEALNKEILDQIEQKLINKELP